MNRTKLQLGSALSLMLLATGAARVTAATPPAAPAASVDERITINVSDAEARDVFRSFAQLAGAEVDLDSVPGGPLTMHVERVRLKTALDVACDTVGCRWELETQPHAVLRVVALGAAGARPERRRATLDLPIDLHLRKAQVTEVVKTFAEILGAELTVNGQLTGTVDIDLDNAPCRQAIDTLCAKAGCWWALDEGAKRVLSVSVKRH
jgi:type II secretory pathway component GspD/PulD (secretin)